MAKAWSATPQGARFPIWLTPKADRDAIKDVRPFPKGMALAVRARAVAENGKANRALLRFIAQAINVAPRDVSLERGQTSRDKTIHIAGDSDALAKALENRGRKSL